MKTQIKPIPYGKKTVTQAQFHWLKNAVGSSTYEIESELIDEDGNCQQREEQTLNANDYKAAQDKEAFILSAFGYEKKLETETEI